MSPEQFIPVAEETGLIVPMGAWVLRTACAQAARWQQLPGWSDLEVAVNVSARQVEQVEFAAVVADIVGTTGLSRGTLWLEITESTLLDDVQTARTRLDRLRALGARIALDDFGTGYSSLTYLRRFPVDGVKLDQSFVQGIGVDPGDAAIVEAVVGLAVALGKVCIAEGVETVEQADALTALGCDSAQGYLFSEPLAADEVTELLVATTSAFLEP